MLERDRVKRLHALGWLKIHYDSTLSYDENWKNALGSWEKLSPETQAYLIIALNDK